MMNRWSVAIGLIDIGGMDTSGTGYFGLAQDWYLACC